MEIIGATASGTLGRDFEILHDSKGRDHPQTIEEEEGESLLSNRTSCQD